MRFPNLVALSAVAVLAIAACGSSGAPPAGATPTRAPGIGAAATPTAAAPAPTTAPVGNTVDVCTLLTGAEVKAATGKNYGEGYNDTNLADHCFWNTDGFTVNRGDLIGAYIVSQDLAFFKSSFGQGGVDATVSGHAAFWNPSESLQSMWIDIGAGRLFVLSLPRGDKSDSAYQALAMKLAEIAVGRI